ncbi:hypothetical protein AOLI_G00326360 [Acnodon oligacanthus]
MDGAHHLDSPSAPPSTRRDDGKSESNTSGESEDTKGPCLDAKDFTRPLSDDDIVTVEFYAVLQEGITFEREDSMWICGQQGKIRKMSIKSESTGTLFNASIEMDTSEMFVYKYCLFSKNGKEISEQFKVGSSDAYMRVLDVKKMLQSDCKVGTAKKSLRVLGGLA